MSNIGDRYKEFKLAMDARAATSDEFQILRETSIRAIFGLAKVMADVQHVPVPENLDNTFHEEFDKMMTGVVHRIFLWSEMMRSRGGPQPSIDELWKTLLESLTSTMEIFTEGDNENPKS